MKFKGLFIALSLTFVISACSQTDVKTMKLESKEDTLAYALGILNFEGLSEQGLELDPLIIAKGTIEAGEGEAIFDGTFARNYYTNYMSNIEAQKVGAEFKDVKEAGEAFLNKNLQNEGVMVTASGLQYKVLTMGDGEKPTANSIVRVHYTGTLIDGTEFDSSYSHTPPDPAEFPLTGVITGWTEGLQLMPVGSKFMFYIPNNLAWGPRGSGPVIEPFAAVVFEVELLAIVN